MKVKPEWTLKALIRTFSYDISIYNDYVEGNLWSQPNAYGRIDETPLRALAKVLGLTYFEIWRYHQVDQIVNLNFKPRRVSAVIEVMVDDTRLQAEIYIKTILGRERAFVIYNPDVLNGDLSQIWDLQKVLRCHAEFYWRGAIIKRT